MSEKNLDKKGRWRKRIVAVRMSDEEAEMLNRLVSASGMSKQDSLLSLLLAVICVVCVRAKDKSRYNFKPEDKESE